MSIVTLPQSNKQEARNRISHISRVQSGHIYVSSNASQRMLERTISMRQLLQVLREGSLVGDIEWDTDVEQGWKMRLQRITAGATIVAIAKLVERGDEVVVVLTTFESS